MNTQVRIFQDKRIPSFSMFMPIVVTFSCENGRGNLIWEKSINKNYLIQAGLCKFWSVLEVTWRLFPPVTCGRVSGGCENAAPAHSPSEESLGWAPGVSNEQQKGILPLAWVGGSAININTGCCCFQRYRDEEEQRDLGAWQETPKAVTLWAGNCVQSQWDLLPESHSRCCQMVLRTNSLWNCSKTALLSSTKSQELQGCSIQGFLFVTWK